jgi:glutathione synthase/RimK-type ligase-like ATP-grasp enzyme
VKWPGFSSLARSSAVGKAAIVMNATVAIACCRRTAESDPDDLYPDPDADPLQSALDGLGASSMLVSWDNPNAKWGSFSHVLVSSTWDSVDRPDEYLAWARAVSAETALVNSETVLAWGLDKLHQAQLAAAGVPVIPTTWIKPGDAWSLPESDYVVKPAVSAGGRNTARYIGGDSTAIAHVEALHLAGQTVMIQPYLSAIDDKGEVDVIFFDAEVSHAVLKKPLLTAGEGVVERPWERMAWDGIATLTGEQLNVAKATIAVMCDALAEAPAYARVDLITGPDGTPLVLEVEVVDPYLSLDMDPSAATRLASALLRR